MRWLVFAAALAGSTLTASAQDAAESTQYSAKGSGEKVALSANVLGIGTLNPTMDLDVYVGGGFSLGAAVWWEVLRCEDRWGQVKATWWPGGSFLRGFNASLTAGWHYATGDWERRDEIPDRGAATLGFLGGYALRFGPRDRIALNALAGCKLAYPAPSGGPIDPWYPEARCNVGWTF